MTDAADPAVAVEELSREDGREMFGRAARGTLGISGEEFLARWDAGDYADADDPAVTPVAMLIPFARQEASPQS